MLSKVVCTAAAFIVLLTGAIKRQVLLPMVKTTSNWWARTDASENNHLDYRYFLHITDMHVDPNYVPGSSPSSACHRGRRQSLFDTNVGRFGAPGEKCDAPILLMQQTLDWVAREWGNKLDFIIWTGDNARHDWDKRQGRPLTQVQRLNQLVTDRMLSTFPNTPIIPCLGNNDVYPHNQIVADDAILPFFSHIWQPFIPSGQMHTFRHYGYFSIDLKHVRVISLNTMYFMKKNDAVKSCRKPGPARDHIEWLRNELERARADKVKVLIMGHVPPSPRDYKRKCFESYLHVVSKYSDIIVGSLYGHLNVDHFLIYDVQSARRGVYSNFNALSDPDDHFHATRDVEAYVDWLRNMYEVIDLPKNKDDVPQDGSTYPLPIVTASVSPSVLPVYYPTVRIYRYSVSTEKHDSRPFTLLGYTQFYSNTTRWEEEHGDEPLEYELEYDTKDEYGLDDLSVENLLEFAKNLIENDAETDWITYTRNMFVRTQNDTLSR